MRVTEIEYPGSPPVDGYGPGFFRVAGGCIAARCCCCRSGQEGWRGLPGPRGDPGTVWPDRRSPIGMGAEIAPLANLCAPGSKQAGIGGRDHADAVGMPHL